MRSACAWRSAPIEQRPCCCAGASRRLRAGRLWPGRWVAVDALAAGQFLGNQLFYGMNPYNPLVTLIAVVRLRIVGADRMQKHPAFRASLISPLEALRAE